MDIWFSQHCWKDCPFPTEWSWHSYQRSFNHIHKFLFMGYSVACMSVFMPVPHCFDYCSFIVTFEIRKWEISNLVFFFFSRLCWLLGVPWDSILMLGWVFLFLYENSFVKTHPFKVYNSKVISIFTDLCSSYHCLIPEYFHRPKKKPQPTSSHSLLPPPLSPKQPLVYFLALD